MGFPWAAWLFFVAFGAIAAAFSYASWHRIGPESWYVVTGSESSFAVWRMCMSSMLPIASMLWPLSLAVVFHEMFKLNLGSVAASLANALVVVSFVSFGLSAILGFATFLIAWPQQLIPPVFRRRADG